MGVLIHKGDDIEAVVEKMDIADGSVLTVRPTHKQPFATVHRIAQAMSEAITKHGFERVTVIVLDSDTQLEALDEVAMREHGWVRAEPTRAWPPRLEMK